MATIYGIELNAFNLTLVILSLSWLYWYLSKYDYFSYSNNKELTNGQPASIRGYQRIFRPMPQVDMNWAKLYGKIYRVDGKLTVAEPELIKQIMVKDFNSFTDRQRRGVAHPIIDTATFFARGDTWKRVRSISTPTFTSGKIKQMYPLVRECLADLLTEFNNWATNGTDVDLKMVFGNYTMDVIARCAFGTKINAHIDPNNPFVTNAKKTLSFKLWRLIAFLFVPKFILKALGLRGFAPESANEFFFNIARNLIKMRRTEKKKYTDFLQLLMDAKLEESENQSQENNTNLMNKHLTENEILGQAWIFFIAGYETTAATLTFCAYELAINNELQEKLYNEIVAQFDTNGEINYEILSKLPYLDACLSETLRKYPPLVRIARTANEDYNLGDTGIIIKKDKLVEIPVYAIHHNEEYFPNPEHFDPERFMPENREKIVPYSYLPFGSGPRLCLGMRFALMEAKLCLAHIIKNYRLMRNDRTDVPVKFRPRSPVLQVNPLKISIEKRS